MLQTVDPDQTVLFFYRNSRIWVYTVYPDLSHKKLMAITVCCHEPNERWKCFQTHLELNNFVMFKDRQYFEDPDSFKPERWLRDGSAKDIHPYILTPFGHGPRMCAGIVLGTLLSNYLSLIKRNKNQKWDPLRAMKTFIRRKVGHTT